MDLVSVATTTAKVVAMRQVLKPRVVTQVRHVDRAGGAIALFGDNDLRLAFYVLIFTVVVLLAMNEGDYVGVLLDGARLAQIAQQWLLVAGTLFGATG